MILATSLVRMTWLSAAALPVRTTWLAPVTRLARLLRAARALRAAQNRRAARQSLVRYRHVCACGHHSPAASRTPGGHDQVTAVACPALPGSRQAARLCGIPSIVISCHGT